MILDESALSGYPGMFFLLPFDKPKSVNTSLITSSRLIFIKTYSFPSRACADHGSAGWDLNNWPSLTIDCFVDQPTTEKKTNVRSNIQLDGPDISVYQVVSLSLTSYFRGPDPSASEWHHSRSGFSYKNNESRFSNKVELSLPRTPTYWTVVVTCRWRCR